MLVVRRNDPFNLQWIFKIVVPRNVLDGLVTAMHIKFDHPTKHQLNLVTKSIDLISDSCHICASLKKFPDHLITQSIDEPIQKVGISFAADVL